MLSLAMPSDLRRSNPTAQRSELRAEDEADLLGRAPKSGAATISEKRPPNLGRTHAKGSALNAGPHCLEGLSAVKDPFADGVGNDDAIGTASFQLIPLSARCLE